MNELHHATMEATARDAATGPVAAKLAPCRDVTSLSTASAEDKAGWYNAGLRGIAAGHLAVLILAGGQGTRLGSSKPKGEYNIGLPSQKPLFQLQAERVIKLKSLAAAATGAAGAVSYPVYVMTSPMTDADTRSYWIEHDYFGLPKEDVVFFSQGTLPCLTEDGKIILETGSHVAAAPDGNGGIYRALHLSGAVADMERRGVQGVHVFAVDNAIVKAGDPTFCGFCLQRAADVGSKACPKAGPHEKVGVLCLRDGVYSVVEYSEMDKATAEMRDDKGQLLFNAGNICIHYYSLGFLQTACHPDRLPRVYHLARKAIPYADPDTGATVSKEVLAGKGNTGIKLESFIFDVFPAARAMAVLEISRDDEFSPVKNAPGSKEDSPDTARAMIAKLHTTWLQQAGVTLAGGAVVEVSPLVSYGGEGLSALSGLSLPAATSVLVQAASEALPAAATGAATKYGEAVEVVPCGTVTVVRV